MGGLVLDPGLFFYLTWEERRSGFSLEVFVSCSGSYGWNMLTMKKKHKRGLTGTAQEYLRDLKD